MSKFRIERGVPMPLIGGANQAPIIHPFAKMEVGDSFLVPVARINNLRENRRIYARISNDARRYRKRHDRHFSVSIRTEQNGFRVWRVS